MRVNKVAELTGKLLNNKGIKNLSMKALVKGVFFLFNLYIINTFPIPEVASFSIFYTTARFLSFFGVDSMHITRFSEIRDVHLTGKDDTNVVDKIKTHLFVSHLLLLVLSFFIFDDVEIIISANIVAFVFSAIRLFADFSRVNNTIWMSIIIEDLLFTLGFIFLSVVFLSFFDNIIYSITLAAGICGSIAIGYALFHFEKNLRVNFFSLGKFDFSISRFWFFNKFTLLKGITVFVLYLSRQFGDYYYGEKMVAETHLLIIFINVFTLVSNSIIGAFQNEIVLRAEDHLDRRVFLKAFKKLTIPILYFVFLLGILLIVFSKEILLIIAPNYAYLEIQFICMIILVFLYFVVNPIFYFFYMNKRVNNLKSVIVLGYLLLIIVVLSGMVLENYWIWFFSIISIIVIIPIMVSINNLKHLKK
ncbi:hypothetical protein ACWGOQ_0018605 [Aquimarina sp. M1]